MYKKIKTVIAPSILSADFAILYQECKNLLDCGADSLHIDIMDGHFVPNLTFGPPVISSIRKRLPDAHFDCHLMVQNPQLYIQPLKKIQVNAMTIHYQAKQSSLEQILDKIKQSGMSAGVSIKPKTQVTEKLEKLIEKGKIDKVLIMTVQPGFGGQKFMQDMMPKVKYLRDKFSQLDIQVDGGIDQTTIDIVGKNGANCIVSGTGIFGAQNRKQRITEMKANLQKYFI